MTNFEFTRIIDGEEVKAITTYATKYQLYLKLLNDDFKGMVGYTISFISRAYIHYMDNSGNFTETGIKSINEYIKSLHQAYKLFLPKKIESNEAIETIIKMVNTFNLPIDDRLETIYNQRKEHKLAFKSGNIDLANYQSQLKLFSLEIDDLKKRKSNFYNQTVQMYIHKIYGLTIKKGACCDDVYCAILNHFRAEINNKIVKRFN